MTDLENKLEIRDERLKMLRDMLQTEKEKLAISRYNYDNNGGFGKRTGVTKHEKQIQLIELALKGVEYQCTRCNLHLKNATSYYNAIKEEKENGATSIDINRVLDIINALM